MGSYPAAVVIPTRMGWPLMRISVDAVLPQVQQTGGQLVIADASGLAIPVWAAENGVLWLAMPGVPGYDLRQAGYAAADAPVIAITEDHCAPAPNWLAQIIEEHEKDPDAAVIYGIVENGSRQHMVDWALYGVGYLAWAPPAPLPEGSPGHANLSFKARIFREVVPTGDAVLEFRYIDRLRRSGYRVVASNRLRVTHYQSAGIAKTSELFFHNGRAIAGLRRQRMTGRDWTRALAPALIAGYRTLRTLDLARSKPELTTEMFRSSPMIALLHLMHASGESLGYLTGPGDSGSRVH